MQIGLNTSRPSINAHNEGVSMCYTRGTLETNAPPSDDALSVNSWQLSCITTVVPPKFKEWPASSTGKSKASSLFGAYASRYRRYLKVTSLRRGTTVNASQLPLPRCKAPLSRIVSGAISSELPLPFTFYLTAYPRTGALK